MQEVTTEMRRERNDSDSRICTYKDAPYILPKTTLHHHKKKSGAQGPSTSSVGSPGETTGCEADDVADEAEYEDVREDDMSESDVEWDDEEMFPHPHLQTFCEEELLAASFQELGTERLPHSTTTKAAAVVMIMAFVVAHGLTWSALGDLIKLINTLFEPELSVIPRSKYLFRKLWSEKAKSLVTTYFYCKECKCELQPANGNLKCTTCATEVSQTVLKQEGSFFVLLELAEQIKHVIYKTKVVLHESLLRITSRVWEQERPIEDITDGQAYEHLRHQIQNGDISLTVNTDGSPVFSSSGKSVWPIQFLVNELPPSHRFENCTVAGLWFDDSHPNMLLFFDKFVQAINTMQPITWSVDTVVRSTRAHVLCCCLDAPARASVQNCVLFNGFFGCPWCMVRGTFIEGSLRYTEYECADLRTQERAVEDMKLALVLGEPVNGYKGPSPVINLEHFNIIWGFNVEAMHAVYLGVTRQLMELFFSTPGKPYYIGRMECTSEIDRRLLSIRPPHCFTRLPRSLKTRAFWKASELQHWLLFYALPCMFGILPERYWNHLKKLAESIFVLLQRKITLTAIAQAEDLLQHFVASFERLYDSSSLTFNVHQLLHLPETARQMGPLWSHSAFIFESGNGQIMRQVTAAKGVPNQVVERIVMNQQLQCFLARGDMAAHHERLCRDMLGYRRVESFSYVDGICLLGAGRNTELTETEQLIIESSSYGRPDRAVEYQRFTANSQVYHARSYTRSSKSDSTVVKTKNEEYFTISKIVCFSLEDLQKCVLLCHKIVPSFSVDFPHHIKPCFFSQSSLLSVVLPRDVDSPCVLLNFDRNTMYICDLPNDIERD